MKQATVSVVIPLYNKAQYIQRALDSVLQQTVQTFEIIVVDDGSTDGGSEIVRMNTDPRIRLLQQKNAGVSVARNRGIATAQADLIAFLDADDAWKPAFLATVQRLRDRFPEAGIYATSYMIGKTKDLWVQPKIASIPNTPWEGIIPNYFKASLDEPPFFTSSVAIPKGILADIGGFPIGVHRSEDLDVWLRVALKYPIAFSTVPQAIYFQDTTERSGTRHPAKTEAYMIQTAKQALQRGAVPQHLCDDLLEYIAKYQIQVASECVVTGHASTARHLLHSCPPTKQFRIWWVWWYFWASLPRPLFQLLWPVRQALISADVGR